MTSAVAERPATATEGARMPDPREFFTAEQIVSALGANRANVQQYWPKLAEQMVNAGIDDRATAIGVLATVAVEVGSRFEPIPDTRAGDDYKGRLDLATPARRWAPLQGAGVHPDHGAGELSHVRSQGRGAVAGRRCRRAESRSAPGECAWSRRGRRDHGRLLRDRGIPAMANRGDWRPSAAP